MPEPSTPLAEPAAAPVSAPEVDAGPALPTLKLVHGSTAQDVADKTDRSVGEIVKQLISLGEMATASSRSPTTR